MVHVSKLRNQHLYVAVNYTIDFVQILLGFHQCPFLSQCSIHVAFNPHVYLLSSVTWQSLRFSFAKKKINSCEKHWPEVKYLCYHIISYHIISGSIWYHPDLLLMLVLIIYLRQCPLGFSTARQLFFPLLTLFIRSESLSPVYTEGEAN